MTILVMNNGSTSCRFCLYDLETDQLLAKGGTEMINTNNAYFKYETYNHKKSNISVPYCDYEKTFYLIFNYLLDKNKGVIDKTDDIVCIGHRIVHGGEKYKEATIITEPVLEDISNLKKVAPLHNESSLEIINIAMNKIPEIKNIAVFDTSFHLTIPKENYTYAIPKELNIRKYGFHGISCSYSLGRLSELLKLKKDKINAIICHMGGGSSITAVKNGKSIDTTMEYTPLSGMIMTNRSGSVDPTVILEIMKRYNYTIEQAIEFLNTQCGYFGFINEKDSKRIVEMAQENNKDAILLRKMINHDFKKNLFAMASSLEDIDSIVLTGGIMSKSKDQRELLLSNLDLLGIEIDKEINKSVFDIEKKISTPKSKIPVYVIPADEEKEIENECKKLIKRQ